MKRNKKGTIFDMIIILGIVILMVMVSSLVVYFTGVFNDAINSTTTTTFTTAQEVTNDFDTQLPGALDFIMIMIMLGFPLASMILAFFNDIHPLFFYANLVIVILIVLIGWAYGGLYEKFETTSIGLASSVSMPMTSFIMSHYGLYALFASFIILFGTYVKLRSAAYGY